MPRQDVPDQQQRLIDALDRARRLLRGDGGESAERAFAGLDAFLSQLPDDVEAEVTVVPYEMADADRRTIAAGTPVEVLMDRAGRAVAWKVRRLCGSTYGQRVVVVCGKGNNGGDGFVIARHLWNRGTPVEIVLLARGEDLGGDARVNFDIATRMGIPLRAIGAMEGRASLNEAVGKADLLVDALLGTGASGAPQGLVAEAIDDHHLEPIGDRRRRPRIAAHRFARRGHGDAANLEGGGGRRATARTDSGEHRGPAPRRRMDVEARRKP